VRQKRLRATRLGAINIFVWDLLLFDWAPCPHTQNRTFRSGRCGLSRFGMGRFGHGTFRSGDTSVTTFLYKNNLLHSYI